MKVPFWVWPFSWGLSGVDREVAKAGYYLKGEQLERRLADLKLKGQQLDREMLRIDRDYFHITDYEFDIKDADFEFSEGTAKELHILDVKLKHKKITQTEYEKQVATVRKLPWVNITRIELDENNVSFGNLELDWNEYFIEELHKNGHVAKDEDESVNLWLASLCRNIALDEFAGMGSVDDLDDENETRQRTTPKKDKLENGRWEAR